MRIGAALGGDVLFKGEAVVYGADAEEIYVEDETFDGDMTGGDLHPTVRSRRARAEGRKRNLARVGSGSGIGTI